MQTYKIKVNTSYELIRKIGLALLIVAGFGFCLWYVVDLPVKDQPAEISIPYYLWLPTWLTDIFIGTVVTTILALVILKIRKNSDGRLQINSNSVDIESKKVILNIQYSELKRVNFIADGPLFPRYSIEFIYHNLKFTRVRLYSEIDFNSIFDKLRKVVPEGLELDITSFDSPDI